MLKYFFLLLTTSLGAFTLESPDFYEGGEIPLQYGCAGRNISPELIWEDPPETTKSFALVVTDTTIYRVHTKVLHIEGDVRGIKIAGLQHDPICPPPGERHSYEFALHALDITHISNISQLPERTISVAKLTAYYTRPIPQTKKVAFLSGQ